MFIRGGTKEPLRFEEMDLNFLFAMINGYSLNSYKGFKKIIVDGNEQKINKSLDNKEAVGICFCKDALQSSNYKQIKVKITHLEDSGLYKNGAFFSDIYDDVVINIDNLDKNAYFVATSNGKMNVDIELYSDITLDEKPITLQNDEDEGEYYE